MLTDTRFRRLVLCVAAFVVIGGSVFAAENRQALLIANSTYANFSSLGTPVNEAQDLAAALTALGFHVTLLKNASREQMLDALDDFGLAFKGKGGIAFFHYGGHGVQVEGKNYLIPVDADIPDERKAATRAVDVDEVMTTLDASGADTSIVILDACRNNPLPAGAARSASRGLSVVGIKPKNSVIVYSAEAGTTAQDGLFTPALTRELKVPGLSLSDVFTNVRREVYDKSNGSQTPGEYNQLFNQVYLAGAAATPAPALTPTVGAITVTPGSLRVSVVSAGTLRVAGQDLAVPAGGTVPLDNLSPGDYPLTVSYPDGQSENRSVHVLPGQAATVAFSYEPPAAAAPERAASTLPTATSASGVVLVTLPGGTFTMGGLSATQDRDVTLGSFMAGATEVTQSLYRKVTGNNPSTNKGDTLPVDSVSWYDAVAFCNKLSQMEGLTPAYTINGTIVGWRFGANGYRLPTNAEWEYAAAGGSSTLSQRDLFAGAAAAADVAWFRENSGSQTHPVAQKKPNVFGMYDLAGNVDEWCWDWHADASAAGPETNPTGPRAGTARVYRGGNALFEAVPSMTAAWGPPGNKNGAIGFRVVRSAAVPPAAIASPAGKPNGVGMQMVSIPGGSFTMGMTPAEASALMPEWKDLAWFKQSESRDMPPRRVTLSGFLMSSTDVTQAQYQKIMRTNPSHFKGDTLPVETVSWLDAVSFCNALSKEEKRQPVYTVNGTAVSANFKANGYRLPTEAEWEYAALGGAQGTYEAIAYAGSQNPEDVAWDTANSGGATHPVAQLPSNGYGLYDMAGNVWQWVWDWYGAYKTGDLGDPTGPGGGAGKVKRGGSFSNEAPYARSAVRWVNPADYKANNVGFRVVLGAGN